MADKKIMLTDGKQRMIHKDGRGQYVIMGGIKQYVEYKPQWDKYSKTGEWGHLPKRK